MMPRWIKEIYIHALKDKVPLDRLQVNKFGHKFIISDGNQSWGWAHNYYCTLKEFVARKIKIKNPDSILDDEPGVNKSTWRKHNVR